MASPTSAFQVRDLAFPETFTTRYWQIDGRPLSAYSWPLVKLNGIEKDLWIYLTSPLDFWRADAMVKGHYTLAWFREYFKPGDVFYDVGANVGVMSMVAQSEIGGLEIHAFEPVLMSAGQMTRNLVLNGLNENVHTWPLALWDKKGIETMSLNGAIPGTSMNTFEDIGKGYREKVMTRRMDDVDVYDIPDPNHVKIDVDGVEDRVVKGMSGFFGYPELRTVQVEISRHLNGGDYEGADGIYKTFKDAGFELVSETPHGTWCGMAAGDNGVAKDVKDCLFVRNA